MSALVSAGYAADATPPSVAFHYGRPLPVEALSFYDRVVVEAENVRAGELRALTQAGVEVFAYVSVGEVARNRPWIDSVRKDWIIGENASWNSLIVDPAHAGWRGYLVERRMAELWAKGYRGFFWDTLDSYERVVTSDAERVRRIEGIATLTRETHEKFTGVRLLFNRGFDVLPRVASQVSGLVVESMFRSFDPKTGDYLEVPDSARAWLLEKINAARRGHEIPVTVIDYVSPSRRDKARETAERIARQGFTPWVTTPGLDTLGVGALEFVPRRILAVYDGKQADLAEAPIHQQLTMPVEYYGYVVDYHDVRADPLPKSIRDRYAAIVTWFVTDDALPHPDAYRDWLLRQIDGGIRVAIVEGFGFQPDPELLKRLGLEPFSGRFQTPMEIVHQDELLGFEMEPPPPRPREVMAWRATGPEVVSHLGIKDATGRRIDPVVTAPWGGLALAPYVISAGFEGRMPGESVYVTHWVVDPFTFLKKALALPPIPRLDLTTENGYRLMTTHIDGDGFVSRAEMPGTPFAGRVILDRVLKRFRVPTTVSIVEGEIGPEGLFPQDTPKLETIAQEIFRLPNVEVASHTFSHPYDWYKVQAGGPEAEKEHMPIPNYRFDLRREITGSVAYINEKLVPNDKPVKVFLWSGYALPGRRALEMTEAAGLANMNGGDTKLSGEYDSLTWVSPVGLPLGDVYQVYAPVQNENVYTNLWTGPFYGYRDVIDAYKLLDAPRRLKPVALYYHFYSGSKLASLKALVQVYEWALSQETIPIFVSEFTEKALEFRRATFARTLDGGWQMRGLRKLRTVRLDAEAGWPDMRRSRGVAGVREIPQGRFVSLAPDGPVTLHLSRDEPGRPYLKWANAVLQRWDDGGTTLRLKGWRPVELALGGLQSPCELRGKGGVIRGQYEKGTQTFGFAGADSGEVRLVCP